MGIDTEGDPREQYANWKAPDSTATSEDSSSSVDISGKIKERLVLEETIEEKTKAGADEEELKQLQDKMAEIDKFPGMMDALQERAANINPTETWEAQKRQSKEK